MGLTRVQKISILLGISGAFFVVELAVGYVVGSLALIADAYHMLNDTMSLGIALYAIKLSKRSADAKYSYGWHRAEVIAALVNGVFLLALCFSIFMESLERFAHPPVVDNPRLVVIVGAVGLGCNIFGLFLFHEHGHDHGNGQSHSHGHSHGHEHNETPPVPITTTARSPPVREAPRDLSIRRSESVHSMYGHPAQTRVAIQQAAHEVYEMSIQESQSGLDREEQGRDQIVVRSPDTRSFKRSSSPIKRVESDVEKQKHAALSEGALNVRAVLVHVAGDALGSLGVIVSGLIIWLTKSKLRYYADPSLSVAITILIMCSAVPLVRSAGFILLQGVPSSISLATVREAIKDVEGVESVHELHVWQLSETRLIASVHIKVSPTRPYMDIVKDVKGVLHQCGIHSGTVQPEFADDESDTKCEITCPPNTCSVKEACCPLPPIKEA